MKYSSKKTCPNILCALHFEHAWQSWVEFILLKSLYHLKSLLIFKANCENYWLFFFNLIKTKAWFLTSITLNAKHKKMPGPSKIKCLFVSRVRFCYCLTNVSVFAVFPWRHESLLRNPLLGGWFRDLGFDPFYRIIEILISIRWLVCQTAVLDLPLSGMNGRLELLSTQCSTGIGSLAVK